MAYSYNGWYASSNPGVIGISSFDPLGVPFPSGVKGGDVEVVFDYLVRQLHLRVEPIMRDPGCWGYYYRYNVNNPSSLSCHASGTAIDYNAPKHPNGVGGTWSASEKAEIKQILAELDYVIRWLEGYDEMHFEIRSGADAVKRVADKIRKGNVTETPPTTEVFVMDATSSAQMRQMLNESETQIASAIRMKVDEAILAISGGVRKRDSAGNVIDTDPSNISNADVFTAIEKLRLSIDSLPAKIAQAVATALGDAPATG